MENFKINRYNRNKEKMCGDIMRNEVLSFIKENHLIAKHSTVLVGVSGGPDSMALLHLLKNLRKEMNLQLIALTVDHQLRGDQSKEDVRYVQEMGKKWDIPVIATKIDVVSYQNKKKVSKQVASRQLRYTFYETQMKKYSADYLALGHHQDDQIETFLMTMTRSASSSSLQGIPMRRAFATGEIIRPLLAVTKEDIKQYCQDKGIEPRIDPSNKDLSDTRVFFRRKVVPLLKQQNPNILQTIKHLSKTIREDNFYLQKQAEEALGKVVTFDRDNKRAHFNISDFKCYPKSLQRRMYHLVLNYLYDGKLPKDLSYMQEEDFFSLIEKTKGSKKLHFPQELHVTRAYEVVSFYFPEKEAEIELLQTIAIPGKTKITENFIITAERVTRIEEIQDQNTYFCKEAAVKLPLIVRNRRPGDRMFLKGMEGRKRISQLFIDEKIPKEKRDLWPLVVDSSGRVLWVIGVRKDETVQGTDGKSWIKLQVKQGDKNA